MTSIIQNVTHEWKISSDLHKNQNHYKQLHAQVLNCLYFLLIFHPSQQKELR